MEILLPRTDAGAIAQVVGIVVVWVAGLVALRSSADGRLLLSGVAMLLLGWCALRTLH